MATDRDRAEKVWRDAYGAYLKHRGDPGPRPHDEAATVIERALAPTDEEREAVREALSLLQRCESSMTVDLAIHRGSTDEDGDRSPTMRLVREVRASLARLDAATGGRE